MGMSDSRNNHALPQIAIIGMAGRFPGAQTLEEFWRNLSQGVESISTFSDSELEPVDGDQASASDPRYVKRKAILDGVELFDAAFFGYTPREAELSDPQQRFFLQCAYEALEAAGYDPGRFAGPIGVFGGCGFSHYLFANLLSNRELLDSVGLVETSIRNRPDHLTTNVAYRLNLKGPAVTVQTACSTSLVAVHLACQSLINFECDMALAGGVSISLPQKSGYLYREGGILSPDGHCRAFDAAAQGTVTGNGAGVIVLKRLEDAQRHRDNVEAVILGSAIGNDGSLKAGYAAPGVEGQAQVVAEAQLVSGVPPATITCVEAHGTGTKMGDPIEIAALNQVFRQSTTRKNFCAIGSVKTNIGHLDTASGVAGLIKVALSLKHKMLPPSLHFETPNPEIDFGDSPFFVNTQLRPWDVPEPRRAGVSSFGIGGTNAHAILEQAPEISSGKATRPYQLLVLSTKTATALETSTRNLASFVEHHKEDLRLADVAYTLQVGRREFKQRRAVLCRDHDDAHVALTSPDSSRIMSGSYEDQDWSVVFMFPGQGAQYINMGKGLYESEPVFRGELEHCAALARPYLSFNLLEVLHPGDSGDAASTRLMQTEVSQPALFAVEYSLARLFMQWGIQPKAMIGHSIGEYVAACLAGVLSLQDALRLVAARGRLMQVLPAGTMLAVHQSDKELMSGLPPGLELAAINGPDSCVVSGPAGLVEKFEAQLSASGISYRRLVTSHAFHSAMMEPVLGSFREACNQVSLHSPQLPYISNLSGTWITAEEAVNPDYWVRHLRETVRFGDGLHELLKDRDAILMEIGPARTLSTLARRNPYREARQLVLNSLRHADDTAHDSAFLLNTLGKLWVAGVRVDWAGFHQHEQRKRVPLPPYPFEPQRFWIESRKQAKTRIQPLEKKAEIGEWFYTPSWKRTAPAQKTPIEPGGLWLVFLDQYGCGLKLIEELGRQGAQVFTVEKGGQYLRRERAFTLRADVGEDYELMMKSLQESGQFPGKIVHLWNLADASNDRTFSSADIDSSFWSPLLLARAVGVLGGSTPTELLLVSNYLYDVIGDRTLLPERATLLGPCRVVPQEYPNISCRHFDVDILPGQEPQASLWSHLVADFASASEERIIAYRKTYRWAQTFEPLHLTPPADRPSILRDKGTYLITGGLGGIGLTLAEQLARSVKARLILIGRSAFPAHRMWKEWLQDHDEEDPISLKIRRLMALEEAGAEITVFAADVSHEDELREALQLAKERFGEIHGVLHCAGVPGGGTIALKTKEAALAVLAPKIQGTMHLASALQSMPLDFFIVCSSRASVLGGFGQVDYCAAAAFVDVFAHHCRSNQSVPMTSVNWDAWQDVGMLARKAGEWGVGAPGTAAHEATHPFLGRRTAESSQREAFDSVLSARSHWILNEHRVLGKAVMPGVAYLEMARAAAEPHGLGAIEITDAYFIEPLHFLEQEQRQVKAILEPEGEKYVFRVLSKGNNDAAGWRDHATATVAFFEPGQPSRQQPEEIARRCNLQRLHAEEHWVDPGMGPRWRVYRDVLIGQNELLALLELPGEFAQELQQLKLYPTLLDRGLALAKRLLVAAGTYVPMSYRRLRIRAPLERSVWVHIRRHTRSEVEQDTITFDVVLMNQQGDELVSIEEFSEKRIFGDISSRVSGRGSVGRESIPPVNDAHETQSAIAGIYAASLQRGITPKEGQAAFRYILGTTGLPQMIVSTTDLHASMVQARDNEALREIVERSQPVFAHPLHPRPAMQTAYVAPRDEFETKTVESWQRVLGIAEVGIHDNYFDLGGDSVQAIQIIAQMNRQGFQLTPQQLLQQQTIAELARFATRSHGSSQNGPQIPEPASSEFPLSGLNEGELRDLGKFLEETDKGQPE
jgi:phthiocerol/phenolphthiocerol synthesis type-I polyketide synthase E